VTVEWDGNSAWLVETVNSKGFRLPFTKIPMLFYELPDLLVLRGLKSRAERERDVRRTEKYLCKDFAEP